MPSEEESVLDARLLTAVERRRSPVAADDLLRAARVSREERVAARSRLAALEARGLIVRTASQRFTLPSRLALVAGRLQGNPAGFAFCIPDDPDADHVYVPAAAVRPAMHGDRVLVRVEAARRRGRIVKVLERATARVIGVFRRGRTAGVVVPQEQRITVPIVVPRGADADAADGEMVVAEIVRWPGVASDAEARVTAVLGPADDPRVETEAVIRKYDLPVAFPPDVATAARRVPRTVAPETCAARLDLRALPIVTIDGAQARDFDDAVLVERLPTGFRLTVAIADVAHYVTAGSALDLEARARGTSVYFPDRVVPMLPEDLSNGICSLVPGEDRLAKAVRMTFDARGRMRATSFHDAVIRSAARLTYERVRRALVDREEDVRRELGALVAPLECAEALARLLTARRRERGAIDFDLPEAEIVLDPRGHAEAVLRIERSIAEELIEEFMLAANEAVARELARRRIPALHRVHEAPDADAVAELTRVLEGFGVRLRLDHGRVTPGAVQEALRRVAGRAEERLVNTIVLRAMKQARYAAEPLGHFGLALDCYTHFTSPIRRYPDLVVHRLLDLVLGRPGRVPPDLVAIAEESSRRERVAMDAEREIVQLKKIQLMRRRIGETHDGFVSGVAPFGVFVELRDMFVEGLVHVSALGDDWWEHREREHALRGRRTGRRFRIGDPVRVTVAGVSIERRQIDFALAEVNERPAERWRRRRRS